MRTPNPLVSRRCGKRTRAGGECGRWAMHGQQICHMHGGKAPQNLRKADELMRELVHPSIAAMARLIEADDFAAAKFVLEWAGFKPVVQAQVDQQVTIRVIDEAQPIGFEVYELNSGRTDS